MPVRSLSGEFSGSAEAPPPSYEQFLTVHEFEQKAQQVAETTVHEGLSGPVEKQRFESAHGKGREEFGEFEDWDDEKFERAAKAYQARLALQQQQSTGGSMSTAGSSSYRAQSPSWPSSSWASPSQQQTQLSTPSTRDNTLSLAQRDLPSHPSATGAGLSSPPNVPARATHDYSPDIKSSQHFMNSDSSGGHGRRSDEALPPFAPVDTSQHGRWQPHGQGDVAPPTLQSTVQNEGNLPSSTSGDANTLPMFHNAPGPPPLNTASSQSSAPQPPPPIFQSPASYQSPPAFQTPSSNISIPDPPQQRFPPSPSPSMPYRHSDIPSSRTDSSPITRPQVPQRHSEVPNANPQRPPNFVGTRLPLDKKLYPVEQGSSARDLYASAMNRSGAPSVKVEYSSMAHKGTSKATSKPEDTVDPTAFYVSSVSSVLSKRPLPTQPRRSGGTNPGYPPQQQGYVSTLSPQSPYDPSNQNQYFTQNQYQQGMYPNQPQQSFYGSQYPPKPQSPQSFSNPPQPPPPQGYPPTATGGNWSYGPSRW